MSPIIVTPDKIVRALAEDLTTMEPNNEDLVMNGLKHLSKSVKGFAGISLRIGIALLGRREYAKELRAAHKWCADHPLTLED